MPELHKQDRKGQFPEGGSRDEEVRPVSWPRSLPGRFAILAAVALAVTFLVGQRFRFQATVYAPGDVAHADVKAVRDFLVEDREATASRRREAELTIPAVYDYDPLAVTASVSVLEEAFRDGGPRQGPDDDRALLRKLEGQFGLTLTPLAPEGLAGASARQAILATARSVLEAPYARGVVASRNFLLVEARRGVTVRNLSTRREIPLSKPEAVEDFAEVRRRLEGVSGLSPVDALARRLAAGLLRPNLIYNGEETAARRSAAARAVEPVLYGVRAGEMIVREGDRVTEEQAWKLQSHALGDGDRRNAWAVAGLFVVVLLALGAAYDFGRSNVKKFRGESRDLAFLGCVLVLWLLLARVALVVAVGVGNLVPGLPQVAVLNGLPMAAAVMAVRVVLNSETSLLFAAPFAALAAMTSGQGLPGFLYVFAASLVGAHKVARACRRVDFVRAGLWVALAQGAAAWGLALLDGRGTEMSALWAVAGGIAGGVLSGFLALSVLPLAEACLGYTTDMRLMELASLDHPLLRELMLRAPGTYHHSIVTGSLAKSAAEAIGARALLASVAAYYHDIGKLSKPAYFIENQSGGGNRHDKLSPSMSSLILASHVKEGVELARRHRLGRDIADIIQQHHGTSVIHYFFSKACQMARPGLDEVKEADYRYAGPKPRTREAALVLLADAVEASARTLPDPRPARIQGLVQTTVNRIFSDGQLDECDLTLKDLHEIARSFTRILKGIHHQRIDYPIAPNKDRKSNGDLDSDRQGAARDRRGAVAAPGGEGLRRLGL